MKVECTACHTKYVIADDRVPASGARVRCRKCQTVFSVAAPAATQAVPSPIEPRRPPVEPAPTALETIPDRPQPVVPATPAPAPEPMPAAPAPEPVPAARAPVADPMMAPAPEPAAAQVVAPPRAAHSSSFDALPPGLAEPDLTPATGMPNLTQEMPPRTQEPPRILEESPRIAEEPRIERPPVPVQASGAYVSSPVPPGLSDADRQKHERARRLARVLASDIAIYNKDKRDRGVQEGNLVAVLGYEIKKSWEIYKERVTPDLANSTPYFRDALNEIVAEGKKVF